MASVSLKLQILIRVQTEINYKTNMDIKLINIHINNQENKQINEQTNENY